MSSSSDEEDFYDANEEGSKDGQQRRPIGAQGFAEEPSDNVLVKLNSPSSQRETPSPTQIASARPRAKSTDSRRGRSQYRSSLPTPVPAVPAIPEHLLATGKPATLRQRRQGDLARKEEESQRLGGLSSPFLHIQRPSTSGDEALKKGSPLRETSLLSPRSGYVITNNRAPPSPDHRARRQSLPATTHRDTLAQLENRPASKMHRFGKGNKEDLFLEIANDEEERPPSRSERASSRMSLAATRRSLPAQAVVSSPAELRPRTSGSVFGQRAGSRLEGQGSELHRHVERYRNAPSRASFVADDAASMSGRSRSGLPGRYPTSKSPPQYVESPRSPELPQFGRRRPSLTATSRHGPRPSQVARQQDSYSESPAEGSDQKQSIQDSSAESETQDTVWDELDDLKSRIKKLEYKPNSGAPVSNDSSDRPRTATTAPTTIDSSPKHKQEKKPSPELQQEAEADPEDESPPNTGNASSINNIHPNLHAALAKAKPLLNSSLYRTLEATAADALQLAAMTGSAGPQGTTYTAAAIINGVTVSDRHVRRKADTMCRNLTDLCLALCDGKHEAHSIVSSPITLSTPAQQSPSIRLPRNSLDPNSGLQRSGSSRPMSRLEARRTSILGSQTGSSIGAVSPGVSGGDDLSASEQETTPSTLRTQSLRHSRVERSGSRLQTSRLQRYRDEPAENEDDEPTLRPASRAMTDISRNKPLGPREYQTPQRSPSLRDNLIARRASANAAAFDANREAGSNRELTRVASLTSDSGSRRRFHDPATPPVLEEEGGEYQTTPSQSNLSAQSKRRILSFGPRRISEGLSRNSSLNQHQRQSVRRGVVVE